MAYLLRLLIFFIANFLALGIGSIFTKEGVKSVWYDALQKAPWSPPGFVFGIAWFFIMICFSFFMANMTAEKGKDSINGIYFWYLLQWILNVCWNPVFFKFHETNSALVIITLLFLCVAYFLYTGFKKYLINGLLMIPYFLWLTIAISLNAYISFKN